MLLKTDRLVIRRLVPEDWPSMQAIAADFNHSPYAVYDWPLPTEEQAIRDVTRAFAASQLFLRCCAVP